MGSPGYLSPEQALGEETGPASDVFSLGAVLTFAASGNGPFGAGSLPALVFRVVHRPPVLDEVPAELRPLIERCLAKEPGARPSAGDLLTELAGVQPGAQWLPERITAGLAEYALPAPTSVDAGDAAESAFAPTGTVTPQPSAAADAVPADVPPADGGTVTVLNQDKTPGAGGGSVRAPRLPRPRRPGQLVPVAALVLVAAAVTAFAVTQGPSSKPLAGPAPSGSLLVLGASATASGTGSPTPTPTPTPRKPTPTLTRHEPKPTLATVTTTRSAVVTTTTPYTPAPPAPRTRLPRRPRT
jgi:hypothetical protein